MATVRTAASLSRWELAAETIAVKIRWFGILVGYALVNFNHAAVPHAAVLNALLALGAGYALLDTAYSLRGRVFLGSWPLLISLMEAGFIGLLCVYHEGVDSPFRFYYLLSLVCCAIRHPPRVTYATCALHCLSYGLLYLTATDGRELNLVLTLVMLVWVTWASSAMAWLLKSVGEHLGRLNAALEENQAQLEARIAERTRELQEAQAHVLHQEKMAAFGLLAAGIAHEVGNPLTSISSLVQLLQKRDADDYTREKLALVNGQLHRIQTTLRELINFSRPANGKRARVDLRDILQEALNIAKYYTGPGGRSGKRRAIEIHVPDHLPTLWGMRDQLVQVFLNLILNAVDATNREGRIEIRAEPSGEGVEVTVQDDGLGIAPEHAARLFQPYFTTKKYGTGLGLFVTRKLLANHEGTVECTSTPGQGTTFRVYLPAAACGLADPPHPEPSPAKPQAAREASLVADA